MQKVGIGIDYSNICKDYNTAYLDRDNKDPATAKCMKSVVAWVEKLIIGLQQQCDYNIYKLNTDVGVKLEEVASNRFLFYSLEKEITLQSYVLSKQFEEYTSASSWVTNANDAILISNDADGEGIYLYMDEGSIGHQWLLQTYSNLSLDEVPLPTK